MSQRIRILALGVLLAACSDEEGSICEPFTSIALPGITRVDPGCGLNGVVGETTATIEDFTKAFVAAGYEVGRDATTERQHFADWIWFRKGNEMWRMSTKLEIPTGDTPRKHPFFSIRAAKDAEWMPEAQFQRIATLHDAHDSLLAKLRGVADFVPREGKEPRRCPPLAELDPALEPDSFLLNLDSSDLAGGNRGGWLSPEKGPATFPRPFPTDPLLGSFRHALAARDELDAIAKRRVIPVMRMKSYTAPKVPTDTFQRTFTPGEATFEISVVDLSEKTVLCRSKAKAVSSETIESTTSISRHSDGTIGDVSTTTTATGDLDRNIRKAAFAELAKMSAVFAPT